MNTKQFSELVQLSSKLEIEKATLVAFFLYKRKNLLAVSPLNLGEEMVSFGLSKPNITRLKKKLVASRAFVKADANSIKLSLKKLEQLETSYPEVSTDSEEVIADDTILPEILYVHTRGYLERVAKQINACYQHNLFDGCAMLMRRLIEMLLFLTYKNLSKESEIQDAQGHTQSLSFIIKHTLANKALGLSKESEGVLDSFRVLGNYSAHGLEYSCRKSDLATIKVPFRFCVEELLYKSGVKK